MADKLTGNAPYYRTVPSSPEPDEDVVLLSDGEQMSPMVRGEKQADKGAAEDEEAYLRRKLLEKKREKEQHIERKQEKTSSSSATATTKQETERPKRERIVWNREQEDREVRKGTASSSNSRSAPVTEEKRTRGGESAQERDLRRKATTAAASSSHHSGRSGGKEQHRHQHEHRHHHKEARERETGRGTAVAHEQRRGEEKRRDDLSTKKRTREPSSSSSGERRTKTTKQEPSKAVEVVDRDEKMEVDEHTTEVEEVHLTIVEISPPEKQVSPEEAASPQHKKPKRYSKFESSPEPSDEEGLGGPETAEERYSAVDKDSPMSHYDEEALEDEDGDELDENLPENKEFEELTEEEKAVVRSFPRKIHISPRFLQLSPETLKKKEARWQQRLVAQLPVYYPGISGCRSVAEYECLNKISEGTFGVVYRAQNKRTDEIVALKRLKMEKEHQGFPITSLREINMLLKCGSHPNVLNVREVVVGSSMDKIYMVMDYVEHDVKSLMELMKSRGKKWTIPQVKTLLRQLISGVAHMHDEFVIHRDLKTSNLLLSHAGILKIGDFGLAREFGDPIKPYTPIVVTLWYRSPELLLGATLYSTAVDMWSVGCIFAEFLKLDPLFPGRTEVDQLQKIFKEVGTPNEQIWPGCTQLPGMKHGVWADTPFNQLRKKFPQELPDDDGYDLLNRLLALDPSKRLGADEALRSRWFSNDPKPQDPSTFPTWPAKSEQNKRPPNEPTAPKKPVGGFTLKFDAPKF